MSAVIQSKQDFAGPGDALVRALAEVEESNPDGCLALRAVRDASGAIVDFECVFANAVAQQVATPMPGGLIGRRLLDLMPTIRSSGRFEAYCGVVETGEPFTVETTFPEGSNVWFRTVVMRLQDGILARLYDITTNKRTERERDALLAREHSGRLEAEALARQRTGELLAAQEKLIQTEKLAVAGQLAAGVGHEINNPLSFVTGNLLFVLEQLTALSREGGPSLAERLQETLQALEDAHKGAGRIRTIVKDLRTFARTDEVPLGPVDVHAVLDFSLAMAMPHIRHRAQVERRYGDVSAVVGHEAKLGQVFLNLLVNAAQAIPEGAMRNHRITLTTRAEGARVVVEVKDTGCGMSAEVLARAFEPFFTTKSPGEGTGLGLPICLSIIRGMNGELTATSAPGQGSTFRVVLGRAEAVVAPTPPPETAVVECPTRRRVLIVDDEPGISSVLRRIIGRAHEVVAVHSGREALALLERDDAFDRVFCDLMMEDVTGMELYARLIERKSRCLSRFVFMTGGSFTESARAFLQEVQVPRLEKPFEPAVIRALVAQASPDESSG